MLFSLCFSDVVSAEATSTTGQQPANVSVARLQRERDEKTEEIRTEREDMKPLLEFRTQVEMRKTSVAKVAQKAAINETISKGKKTVEEMATLSGKVNRQDNRISELQKIYAALPNRVSRALENLPPILPRSTNPIISRVMDGVDRPASKDEPLMQGAIERLLAKLGVQLDPDVEPEPANPESTWESLKKEIQEARSELTTLESQLPKAIEAYRVSQADYYSNLIKGLEAEIAARNAKVKSLQDERDKMEDDLDKAGETQGEINTLLVYAVYAMVLAIVGLFFLLRLFPPELARSIVVERTMIELLSMGFLLLTVIILGTGKLIGAETLGALLGTIAGYIFGQKQGERRGATEERAKMVDLIRGTGDGAQSAPPPAK